MSPFIFSSERLSEEEFQVDQIKQNNNPFADLAPTPAEHFKLYYYAAVLHVLVQVAQTFDSLEAAFGQFPFLVGYHDELLAREYIGARLAPTPDPSVLTTWRDALLAWEKTAQEHLPLRALREVVGLDYTTLTLLLCIGLIEEDARFGLLFEAVQSSPGSHRPTLGLLNAWWREPIDQGEVRTTLRHLRHLGLVQIVNPEAPRIEWALQIPGVLWDVLRGEIQQDLFPRIRYHAPAQLATYDELIIPDELRQTLATIPALLASKEAQALVVRGPQRNGRRTVMGAVARELGPGMLEVNGLLLQTTSAAGALTSLRSSEMHGLQTNDEERWRLIGPLATLLHALPVIVLDIAPGESVELPPLNGYDGPLGLVAGKMGGISGPATERALTVTLEIPDIAARRLHWQKGLGDQTTRDIDIIGEHLRMTSGNIRRTARLAQSYSTLANRSEVTLGDVQQASRALHCQVLETLATYIPAKGDWSQLAVNGETMRELSHLESRCRYRERLRSAVGIALESHLNTGVRALFGGPSGTGKTLAASLLASVLQMDLYRLDLSSVVNKYIGETEKNLNQVLARAEELDVILLLDEGDALLTRRTSVQSSNDRYANLETNYLLQRLENFEGILIVTTNASERIDSAFQRRMDVVIDFRPPDVAERWVIWQLHLPATHAIDELFLREVAARCTLSGGQIRNAVLHASLLGLDDGGTVTASHLEIAIQREYRKMGAVCPLRRQTGLAFDRR